MSPGGAQARQGIVRFGEFEVDFFRQTLALSGVRTKLQKQPFQVLELLIQRAPGIVSRDEIRRHVWGDSVYIDAPQSINFCIRQIHLALGDTSPGRFIETLPRQGYRFIAPLEGVAEDTGSSERPPGGGSRTRTATPRWLVRGLVIFLAFATILAVSYRVLKRNALPVVVRISPITTYPGDEREPSLSPDGRQVAFSWEGEKGDNRDIYVTLLGEPHPLRLTSEPEDDAYPAWSPDPLGPVEGGDGVIEDRYFADVRPQPSETRLILIGINPCSPDTRLDAQETPAKSDGDRVSSVVGPKLPNEVFDVKINRSFGDGEATRYLFIAVAIANQP